MSSNLQNNVSWCFFDSSSDDNIFLHPSSSQEVENFYQRWIHYLENRGSEGTQVARPPQQICPRTGFYKGKRYVLSVSRTLASVLSQKPIQGKYHLDIRQQNMETGFARTLIRTPARTIPKPFSTLKTNSCLNKVIHDSTLTLRFETKSGSSALGYKYEQTFHDLTFDLEDPDEQKLADRMIACYESGEMFAIEVHRDPSKTYKKPSDIPTKLILKKLLFDPNIGLTQNHVQRTEGNTPPILPLPKRIDHIEKEGEPDSEVFMDNFEMKMMESSFTCASKIDIYSYIRRSCCDKHCERMFGVLDVRSEYLNEYRNRHTSCEREAQALESMRTPLLDKVVSAMLSKTNSLSYAIVDTKLDELDEEPLDEDDVGALAKDIAYNKLTKTTECHPHKVGIMKVKLDVVELNARANEEGEYSDCLECRTVREAPETGFDLYLVVQGKVLKT